jgi:hypothetical protein
VLDTRRKIVLDALDLFRGKACESTSLAVREADITDELSPTEATVVLLPGDPAFLVTQHRDPPTYRDAFDVTAHKSLQGFQFVRDSPQFGFFADLFNQDFDLLHPDNLLSDVV